MLSAAVENDVFPFALAIGNGAKPSKTKKLFDSKVKSSISTNFKKAKFKFYRTSFTY